MTQFCYSANGSDFAAPVASVPRSAVSLDGLRRSGDLRTMASKGDWAQLREYGWYPAETVNADAFGGPTSVQSIERVGDVCRVTLAHESLAAYKARLCSQADAVASQRIAAGYVWRGTTFSASAAHQSNLKIAFDSKDVPGFLPRSSPNIDNTVVVQLVTAEEVASKYAAAFIAHIGGHTEACAVAKAAINSAGSKADALAALDGYRG